MDTCKLTIGWYTSIQSLDSTEKSENIAQDKGGQMARIDWAGHVIDYDPRAYMRLKKHNMI